MIYAAHTRSQTAIHFAPLVAAFAMNKKIADRESTNKLHRSTIFFAIDIEQFKTINIVCNERYGVLNNFISVTRRIPRVYQELLKLLIAFVANAQILLSAGFALCAHSGILSVT